MNLSLITIIFFLRKIFTTFILNPIFLSLVLIIAGLVFLSFSQKQRTGRFLVALGAFLIAFFSFVDMSDLLLSPLENQYDIYQKKQGENIEYIAVLSAGASVFNGVPMNTSENYSTLSRLIEGVRVYRLNPGSKIILTGASPFKGSFAEIEKKFLIGIGIPAEDIITEEGFSLNTYDESLKIKNIAGGSNLVLVTSAYHMPRAMMLFRKQGMNPIPAPTDFFLSRSGEILSEDKRNLFNENLIPTKMSAHEYAGILWYLIKD